MPCYILDTNVFNHVLDGKVDPARLGGIGLVATHVQRDELQKTKDESRRHKLLAVFQELFPDQTVTASAVAGVSGADGASASSTKVVPTESIVWDVSIWDQAKWGGDDGVFEQMKSELDAMNKRKKNNAHDILIAETAVKNGWVLVTSDADLFAVVTKYGGACMNAAALS
jgi:predicted nucleic acid-binding protein